MVLFQVMVAIPFFSSTFSCWLGSYWLHTGSGTPPMYFIWIHIPLLLFASKWPLGACYWKIPYRRKEKTSTSQAPIKLFFTNFSSTRSATSRWLRSESTLLPVQTGLRHFTLWVWSLGLDNGAKTFLNIVNVVISLLSKCLLDLLCLFLARQGRPDKTYRERIWSRNQPGLWYVDI